MSLLNSPAGDAHNTLKSLDSPLFEAATVTSPNFVSLSSAGVRTMAPSDDSSPPWRLGTPHDSLNRFTSLLGTFVLKESDNLEQSFAEKALVPQHDALMKLLTDEATEDTPLSFPCLSLVTADNEATEGLERSEVQARAARSMARYLTPGAKISRHFHVEPRETCTIISTPRTATPQDVVPAAKCQSDSTETMEMSEVPGTMLSNLAGSFALLVDARLRAYTTILARHGLALAVSPDGEHKHEAICAVERKLENLIDIGSRISIDNMVTSFQPQSKLGMSRSVDDSVEEVMMPLIMSVVLDITIPKENHGHERVTVSIQATGAIVGTSPALLF